MQKQVHVNAYVKKDGTQVKEHFRNIESDSLTNYEYQNNPINEQSQNLPENNSIGDTFSKIGETLKTVLVIGAELAPIAIKIYQAMKKDDNSGQNIEYLKPQFDTQIKRFNTQVEQIKYDVDNSVKNLVNTKNQKEYLEKYKKLEKLWQTYQQVSNLLSRIKTYAKNSDYKQVSVELENFTNDFQNRITSDIKPENKINNDLYNALENNVNNLENSADFSNLAKNNILMQENMKYNTNRPNAQELANIFLAKPENSPLSKDYTFIPQGYADIINTNYNLYGTNKEIPKDWSGIVYNKYSSLSKNISNSIEMQNQIRNQFVLHKNNMNDKLNVEFTQDSNLFLSIGHATILEPHIDSQGYFNGILFDKYDFDLMEYYENLKHNDIFISIANDIF